MPLCVLVGAKANYIDGLNQPHLAAFVDLVPKSGKIYTFLSTALWTEDGPVAQSNGLVMEP
jgi:hypothetical protein